MQQKTAEQNACARHDFTMRSQEISKFFKNKNISKVFTDEGKLRDHLKEIHDSMFFFPALF